MKQYPSILSNKGKDFYQFKAYTFDKIDGSNLRFEWSNKRGWYKYGTRKRLFDKSDEVFGEAIPIFLNTLADPIEKIAKKKKWQSVIVFAEFWGENSFAGIHDPKDEKSLFLFDVNPYKKGIISPKEFLDLFGDLHIAKFLGIQTWNRSFVEAIRKDEIEGVTFEGVVGKAGSGTNLIMRKLKTQKWIDKIIERYGIEKGTHLIES